MANIFSQIFRSNSTYKQVETFILNDLSIRRDSTYKTEEAVEGSIKRQLTKAFGKENVDNQHYVGGNSGLKIDVDLFKGGCGIEIKMADQLENSVNAQRALGQVLYYSKYYNKSNLMLLVVGRDSELSPKLDDFKEIVEKTLGIHFVYKQAKK